MVASEQPREVVRFRLFPSSLIVPERLVSRCCSVFPFLASVQLSWPVNAARPTPAFALTALAPQSVPINACSPLPIRATTATMITRRKRSYTICHQTRRLATDNRSRPRQITRPGVASLRDSCSSLKELDADCSGSVKLESSTKTSRRTEHRRGDADSEALENARRIFPHSMGTKEGDHCE